MGLLRVCVCVQQETFYSCFCETTKETPPSSGRARVLHTGHLPAQDAGASVTCGQLSASSVVIDETLLLVYDAAAETM